MAPVYIIAGVNLAAYVVSVVLDRWLQWPLFYGAKWVFGVLVLGTSSFALMWWLYMRQHEPVYIAGEICFLLIVTCVMGAIWSEENPLWDLAAWLFIFCFLLTVIVGGLAQNYANQRQDIQRREGQAIVRLNEAGKLHAEAHPLGIGDHVVVYLDDKRSCGFPLDSPKRVVCVVALHEQVFGPTLRHKLETLLKQLNDTAQRQADQQPADR